MTRGCGSKPPAPRFPFCWAKQNGGYPKTGIWVLTQLVVEHVTRAQSGLLAMLGELDLWKAWEKPAAVQKERRPRAHLLECPLLQVSE